MHYVKIKMYQTSHRQLCLAHVQHRPMQHNLGSLAGHRASTNHGKLLKSIQVCWQQGEESDVLRKEEQAGSDWGCDQRQVRQLHCVVLLTQTVHQLHCVVLSTQTVHQLHCVVLLTQTVHQLNCVVLLTQTVHQLHCVVLLTHTVHQLHRVVLLTQTIHQLHNIVYHVL